MLASSGCTLYISLNVFGVSFSVCYDHAPNIFSALPTTRNVSSCNIVFSKTDVLDGIWISLSVFDSSKSFKSRQLFELDTLDCQPS